MAEQLFEKRLEILKLIAHRSYRAGAPPSIREIGEAVGLRSTQTVYHHLGRLEADGYVRRLDDRTRTPVPTEKGWEAVGRVPMLGRVAAGRGLEAMAVGDEAYPLVADLLSSRSGRGRYVLRVIGESMTDARIEEGDLLVVEEDPSPPGRLGGGGAPQGRGDNREGSEEGERPGAPRSPERWAQG